MSKLNINPREASDARVELLNKVWTDDAFADRLQSDPKAVFAEMGGQIPDDVEIRVVRDTENVKHVYIPAAPSEGEIADTDLLGAQGGTSFVCITTATLPLSYVLSGSVSALTVLTPK
ncbi:nitrile hydratase subunit alpha [Hoeflea poritis]|uniref:Nitrile hydratase subunit alpha n=1 Tax=Hoeflea poritis TaxID=2993659 RepID=A0ABT4VML4_9HYPH|nr:nitrile hydratase subunit alpha [Hoeflea poritis]MDA4845859.1 nitrile hydratase subunit alpha [Hoeflea poritis]